jgi:hypothetical protein
MQLGILSIATSQQQQKKKKMFYGRPATSPTPNASPTPYHEMARSGTASHGTKPGSLRGPSNHVTGQISGGLHLSNAPPIGRQLRPLPPSSTKGSQPSSVGGFSMFIEGCRTGEEKVVGSVDRREALPRMVKPAELHARPTAAAAAADGTAAAASSSTQHLHERIRRLEAEVRKLTEQLKKRAGENTTLREQVARLEEELAAMRTQSAASADAHARAAAALNADLVKARAALAEATASAKRGGADVDAARGEAAALQAQLKERDAAAAEWERERARLTSENERFRAEIAQSRSSGDAAARSAAGEADLMRQRLREAEEAARQARAAAEQELDALRRQLADQAASMSDWNTRVKRCNEFVVNICQPQFAVVKDEALTPLTQSEAAASAPGAASDAPQGFVLVPLRLMLDGYALLPQESKKGIADRYERTRQA